MYYKPKKIKGVSRKREKEFANKINGKRHTYSGALWNKKNDVSNDYFLFEDKFTTRDKYVFNKSVFIKLATNAKNINKIPALRIGFKLNYNQAINFIVLREKDILIRNDSNLQVLTHNTSSITLELNFLEEVYRKNQKSILFSFMLDKESYVIMLEDEFIRIYDNIIEGKEIS